VPNNSHAMSGSYASVSFIHKMGKFDGTAIVPTKLSSD